MNLRNFLNPRIQGLAPSPTLTLAAQAKQLKAEGHPVIDLSVGELDFDTPDFAKEAGISAIRQGQTKYTPVGGTPHLKKAVSAYLGRQGLLYAVDEILVGTGAKQLLFNAFFASIFPEDEVIIPAPYWVSYPAMVRLMGGKPISIPCDETCGFKLSAEKLAQAITPKTKWVVLTSPNNPTGMVYTNEELAALGEVLRQHPHVWVMSDDIYAALSYEDVPHIGSVAPFLRERLFVVNGVSKSHAMTGWRIGFGAGPLEFIQALTKVHSQQTSNPCSIAQEAALGALEGPRTWTEEARKTLKRRRDILVQGLSALGLHCPSPQGAFYVYASCSPLVGTLGTKEKTCKTDQEISAYLLKHAMVATVPGAAFGLSPYLRFSYAKKEEDLREALVRIKDVIS